ncbi:retrovirus-related pol polyprotein from transposon TNT 1-94 [Tanacetum coccineum]
MHNNIMAAGSRDRPPMLATGRYAQWRSRFLRYIDTRPNGDALRKCILTGPYIPTMVTTPAVPATEDSPEVPAKTSVETVLNMTPENKAHYESEKEAIHLILTGIGDEIYSTVDACQTAQEMWEAIERFTTRNNLTVATMQVNVQFLQQLQPEWSRFVTIVKQQHKLDEVSYHKLFDILKQYQKEVNELRAERMAKNANPLALVATAQTMQDPYYQTPKHHKSYAPTSKASLPTRSHAATRYKGKEIAKPITPPSESASEEDSDPEQAQKDKDMQKNLALIAKRAVNVVARDNCSGPSSATILRYMTLTGKEFGHFPKECRKPKRQSDWLADTDEEIDEQELEAHYSYMAKIQEVPNADSGTDAEPLEQLDVDDNKKIQKQLKKANATLTQELTECKSILAETSRTLGESNSIRDSCLVALQNKQNEFERYKAFNDRTVDYDQLERKLNETLGLLAQKDIDIQEGLKVKAYEISVVQAKHDELTIDPADQTLPRLENRFILTLAEEIDTKLNKDLSNHLDYTKLNSLYEIFKPPAQHYEIQLAQANAIRKKMWRKSFVKTKPNVFKNIDFLPVSKSVSKSRQAYNVMTNNINHLNELVNQAWVKHSNDHLYLRHPTAQDMEILVKKCLMPLALKTQNDSLAFIHELKQEMHADLKYVESLEDELDELESDKAKFSNMYDMLLQECVSKDVMCSYLLTSSDLDEITELQCLYLHKVMECDCLAQKLSEQTDFVSKEIYTELLQRFARLEKHSISLEIALQECQVQLKNDTVCKERASNVFRKEREQYVEIQDLKAQLQDKNMAISELKKLVEKCKGKSVDTKFDKPSVVRQPNAQRIPKPSVLGKPAPFSDSLERKIFSKKKSVPKTNESEGLSKPVTLQNLPQTATQDVRNTNVIKPGMYRIDTRTTQTRAPQLPQTSRNTNPRVSTSTGVIHRTNVSRPQLRSTQMKDKVVPNTSQVKFKKTEVEDHPRISSISNQTKSVTACNDSLNSRTSNVNAVCATCGKCVFNSNHDACVSKYLNDVNARTKKPKVVPISTRKPKSQANKSVATYRKKTVASESTITNSKSYYRMLYEKTSKAWKWWIAQQCPSGYKWVPKTKMKWVPKVRNETVRKRVSFAIDNIVQLILFIVDSGCTKHMTGNLTLLCNFVEKYLGTVRFGNDQFAPILGYGDLVQGNITINRVYYVEGLNHNLFSVGQFCDADLEVAFRKSTCFVRDLQGNDLLTGNRGSDLYTISLQETTSSTPICLMAKASPTQAWLWHRILSHLNFDYINLLSKKDVVIGLPKDGENLDKMKEKGDPCILVGYSTQSKGYCVYKKKTRLIVESIHLRFDKIKEMPETSVANDTSGLIPQRQKALDYDNSDPVPQLQNVSPSTDTTVSSQELDLLFDLLYDEFFNTGTSRANKYSSPNKNSAPQDTTPTNVNAEENNDNQAEDSQIQQDEFTNPFCTPVREVAESSSCKNAYRFT